MGVQSMGDADRAGKAGHLLAPLNHRTVTEGRTTVAYYAVGRGKPVVFLPSAARGAGDFAPLSSLLTAADIRMICPQPRGIGGSVGPVDNISLADLADDIAAVIRAEGGGPAIVAGHA